MEVLKINKNKLRSIITLHDDNWTSLAKKLGISKQALNKKVNTSSFKLEEIQKIITFYKLTEKEVIEIFNLGGNEK